MKFSEVNNAKSKGSRKRITIYQVLAIVLIILLFSAVEDFVAAVMSKGDVYEVKHQVEETLGNGQMLYQLYRNGEYVEDVDYNKYFLLDSEGNTDFRYCALVDGAGRLTYSVILSIMILIAMRIVKNSIESTPFTKTNVKLLRVIEILQLALAVVPWTVRFLMTFFRFDYVAADITANGFYMLIIAFVIEMIAQVFDYGVRLQEDSDSIA